jgi:adenylate cyclase
LGSGPGERRLVAILAADVVGYSRMVGADEAGTLERLRALRREVIDPLFAEHGGRIFKTTGDGLLAEFPSTVQALRSAIVVQERVRGGELQLRIGVHQGDVVVDGDDLLGDGVNVAARLEGLAEPGGICISGRVREDAAGKIAMQVEDLGEPVLRNIEHKVRVFRVRLGAVERPTLALPDKPSIAVLPFQNMSGDSEQEYFADGIVEEIITGLSRVRSFFVIARNSSFTYKGRAVDIKQVGRELGVRYVLQGSVRKAGDRVRIAAQLVDATMGAHLWAERFDGALEEIFGLQDRVTINVVSAIGPKIRAAEIERAQRKPTESLQAYDLVLRARPHQLSYVPERMEEAKRLLLRAIDIDPAYALALARLAWCNYMPVVHGWTQATAPELAEIVKLAQTAVEYGGDDPEVLAKAALLTAGPGHDLNAGMGLIEKALASNPNDIDALTFSGWLHAHAGDSETAIEHLERAGRINPLDGAVGRDNITSLAHFYAGRYEAAVEFAERALRQNPRFMPALRHLAACHGLLGHIKEARAAVRRMCEIAPQTISVTRALLEMTMPDAARQGRQIDAYCEGLRLAGLPE